MPPAKLSLREARLPMMVFKSIELATTTSQGGLNSSHLPLGAAADQKTSEKRASAASFSFASLETEAIISWRTLPARITRSFETPHRCAFPKRKAPDSASNTGSAALAVPMLDSNSREIANGSDTRIVMQLQRPRPPTGQTVGATEFPRVIFSAMKRYDDALATFRSRSTFRFKATTKPSTPSRWSIE